MSGKGKDTLGMSGSRISPAQLFGVDAFSVCWKWCPDAQSCFQRHGG